MANARRLPDQAAKLGALIPNPSLHEGTSPVHCSDRLPCGDVFGYPARWPAGPWVIPMFWLTVLLLAVGLR